MVTYTAVRMPLQSAAIATVGCILFALYWRRKKALQSKLKEFETLSTNENKVVLHTMKPWVFHTPHGSPAVCKLILFLEYAKIPYIIDTTMPLHFQTTKTPWITLKKHHIPDSNLIIEWLSQQAEFGRVDIDAQLNKRDLSMLRAYKSMVEDGLYFVIVWRNMCAGDNIYKYFALTFGGTTLNWKIRLYLTKMRATAKSKTWAQGIARFNEEEIFKKGEEYVENVVHFLGDKKFAFGDQLTSLDLTIYGHIGTMYQLSTVLTWNNGQPMPFKTQINEYMKRIEKECFGSLKYWRDIA